MKPREKRSLNFLGTAWKWLAGTQDHDDHKIVLDKINNILENSDKQRIINRDTITRINLLTNVTNVIIRRIQTEEDFRRKFENNLI